MRTMPSTLRFVIIAAAALSTVLLGLRDALADAWATHGTACAVEGEAFSSSRADDSGTLSEQVEQDDGNEEHDREILLYAGGTDPRVSDPAVQFAPAPPRVLAAGALRRASRARGPPMTV